MNRTTYTIARWAVPEWVWQLLLDHTRASPRWTPVMFALLLGRTWDEYQWVVKGGPRP